MLDKTFDLIVAGGIALGMLIGTIILAGLSHLFTKLSQKYFDRFYPSRKPLRILTLYFSGLLYYSIFKLYSYYDVPSIAKTAEGFLEKSIALFIAVTFALILILPLLALIGFSDDSDVKNLEDDDNGVAPLNDANIIERSSPSASVGDDDLSVSDDDLGKLLLFAEKGGIDTRFELGKMLLTSGYSKKFGFVPKRKTEGTRLVEVAAKAGYKPAIQFLLNNNSELDQKHRSIKYNEVLNLTPKDKHGIILDEITSKYSKRIDSVTSFYSKHRKEHEKRILFLRDRILVMRDELIFFYLLIFVSVPAFFISNSLYGFDIFYSIYIGTTLSIFGWLLIKASTLKPSPVRFIASGILGVSIPLMAYFLIGSIFLPLVSDLAATPQDVSALRGLLIFMLWVTPAVGAYIHAKQAGCCEISIGLGWLILLSMLLIFVGLTFPSQLKIVFISSSSIEDFWKVYLGIAIIMLTVPSYFWYSRTKQDDSVDKTGEMSDIMGDTYSGYISRRQGKGKSADLDAEEMSDLF